VYRKKEAKNIEWLLAKLKRRNFAANGMAMRTLVSNPAAGHAIPQI
jgi:hypothetical protein